MDSTTQVTQLLANWRDGDTAALNRLIPLVYADLRTMASRRLSEHSGHDTLQPTALVHDVVLRLMGCSARDVSSRQHFFNLAGQAMRQLLVDRARRAAAMKHGSSAQRLPLEEAIALPVPADIDIQALDQALSQLATLDERMAKIVELRWFVGLTMADAAQILDIDTRTAHRDWALAKAWLREQLGTT